MNHPSVESGKEKLSGGGLLFLVLILVVAIFAVVAQSAPPRNGPTAKGTAGTSGILMLVREWDPESGTLIGWLPMHRAAIHVQMLDSTSPPHFDLNEAVDVVWLSPEDSPSQAEQVQVAPKPRSFEGELWLPVKRQANLVRIAQRLFLIQKIIFGESKWQTPANPPNTAADSRRSQHGQ